MPIYAKVGETTQYILTEAQALKRPWLQMMQSDRPTPDAIAQADGTWLEPHVDPQEARQAAYKAEADDLYMDYKAAEEEGQDAAVVESLRQTWLAKRAEIKAAWPK